MKNTILGLVMCGFSTLAVGAEPLIDNERATVWDSTAALPAAQHDFVAITLSANPTAVFGHSGEVPAKGGTRTVVMELKDLKVGPITNTSGLPTAFPRPHGKKLFENERVIVWDYTWLPGEPTPMHWHDKDALVVYEVAGGLKSTTPDGKSIVNDYQFGDVRFNRRDRSHTEILVSGSPRAIITELK